MKDYDEHGRITFTVDGQSGDRELDALAMMTELLRQFPEDDAARMVGYLAARFMDGGASFGALVSVGGAS